MTKCTKPERPIRTCEFCGHTSTYPDVYAGMGRKPVVACDPTCARRARAGLPEIYPFIKKGEGLIGTPGAYRAWLDLMSADGASRWWGKGRAATREKCPECGYPLFVMLGRWPDVMVSCRHCEKDFLVGVSPWVGK